MFHTIQRLSGYVLVSLAVLACLAAVATTVSAVVQWQMVDRYGGGPDNSRYFASRQINKSNVTQLQVAWTYPYGDTSGNPLVVRGVIYGRGRNGSIVAVDAKSGKELWVRENMNGMTNRGLMYWESRDGRDQRLIFAMTDLLQELDAKTGKSIMSFGTDGVVDLRVGIDGRDPATMTNIASRTPGEVFENLADPWRFYRRRLHVAARRYSCVRCADGQACLDVPHCPTARRVRLRHLAEGRVEVRWRREHLG